MPISIADKNDIRELEELLNSAYRGDLSKKGWTTEAHLLEGDIRTDKDSLLKLMLDPDAVFLKFIKDDGKIGGCVFLQKIGSKLYLGMLSVSPTIQAKGIGKQLMQTAEAYARERNCDLIFMRVISLRHELISWYEKQGYQMTGMTEPFNAEERFGKPVQPLEFVIMEKLL